MTIYNLATRDLPSLPIKGQPQTDYFDEDRRLPGFGLRVSAGGGRTWILL